MNQIKNLLSRRLGLIVLLSTAILRATGSNARSSDVANPVLVHTCIVTANFPQLVDFYRQVLRVSPEVTSGNYAEFSTGAGVLALFSAEAQEKYLPGTAEPAKNRSAILEFRVTSVDGEYARLQNIVKVWVKPPANQPWGTRSFYFRDPDGNLVDFYSPAKAE